MLVIIILEETDDENAKRQQYDGPESSKFSSPEIPCESYSIPPPPDSSEISDGTPQKTHHETVFPSATDSGQGTIDGKNLPTSCSETEAFDESENETLIHQKAQQIPVKLDFNFVLNRIFNRRPNQVSCYYHTYEAT